MGETKLHFIDSVCFFLGSMIYPRFKNILSKNSRASAIGLLPTNTPQLEWLQAQRHDNI